MEEPPQLSEKDFIHEGYKKNPFPLWLWFFLLTALMALIWGGSAWYNNKLGLILRDSPFLKVTNREMSLFLWQSPEFMRNNVKEKASYLPGFKYLDKVTLDISQADQYAAAPPELFFRYHTWHRLVSQEFTQRPIPKKEFIDFLSYAEEWHPRYWPEAPAEYAQLVDHLPESKVEDLSTLSMQAMPMPVRMAFEGWTNYFIDKEAINTLKPTYAQMKEFLGSHPHYARNFWRNIVQDVTPNYLKSLSAGLKNDEDSVPSNEMAPFLKVAIYNFLAAQKITTESMEHPGFEVGPKLRLDVKH